MTSYFFRAGVLACVLWAACVSADAATLLTVGDDCGLRSSLLALDATDGEVFSFSGLVAMNAAPGLGDVGVANIAQERAFAKQESAHVC